MGPWLAIRPRAFVPDYLLDLINRLNNVNSAALIGVLSWFDDP